MKTEHQDLGSPIYLLPASGHPEILRTGGKGNSGPTRSWTSDYPPLEVTKAERAQPSTLAVDASGRPDVTAYHSPGPDYPSCHPAEHSEPLPTGPTGFVDFPAWSGAPEQGRYVTSSLPFHAVLQASLGPPTDGVLPGWGGCPRSPIELPPLDPSLCCWTMPEPANWPLAYAGAPSSHGWDAQSASSGFLPPPLPEPTAFHAFAETSPNGPRGHGHSEVLAPENGGPSRRASDASTESSANDKRSPGEAEEPCEHPRPLLPAPDIPPASTGIQAVAFGLDGAQGSRVEWAAQRHLNHHEPLQAAGVRMATGSAERPASKPSGGLAGGMPRIRRRPSRRGSSGRTIQGQAETDECRWKETSKTRQLGACLRCHNQRVRCVPNKQNPLDPCETCLMVRRDTKKTIHHLPCLRFKVTSMTLYRPGGLGLTGRFDHTQIADIPGCSDAVFVIDIAQGLCSHPLRVKVRRFTPWETDVTCRRYVHGGVARSQDVGAFCLADIETTAKEFGEYVERYAFSGLVEAFRGSDSIVQDVFSMIAKHYSSLPDDTQDVAWGAKRSPGQKEFLQKLVHLWFAIRHGSGSAWIAGEERLGIEPGSGDGHPLVGQVSVPRLVVAQFDSIRCERFYKPYAQDVLRRLEALLPSHHKESWFTVFLATFLLLHLTSNTSADRYRHSQQNQQVNPRETRYGALNHPLTGWMEEIHQSAAMLLAHWHYFSRCDLAAIDQPDSEDGRPLMFLEPHQREFVKNIASRMKARLPFIPATPAQGCWEHELFWVSRMFTSKSGKRGWSAPETFTRAKPSVGCD
ncbi:hypothetical protein VTJ83DRAFT_3748 [Remersonia thermophila]|uniref:Zn(2)-C6 fungal-type domain-containing protein n=1 Tax=Remersonia thermophila TaxID=72144 RepID=A0ABR4DF59_9PEZI